MNLTTLEDNVFAPIPGIDAPQSCGGCGARGNNVNQNPVINVNVGNKNDRAQAAPIQRGRAAFEGKDRTDDLIDANRRIAELENRPPKTRTVTKWEKLPIKSVVKVPIDRVDKQFVNTKTNTVIPLDRIQRVPTVVEKVKPLDRIKQFFSKEVVPVPLDRVSYVPVPSPPVVVKKRSLFEGAK